MVKKYFIFLLEIVIVLLILWLFIIIIKYLEIIIDLYKLNIECSKGIKEELAAVDSLIKKEKFESNTKIAVIIIIACVYTIYKLYW